MKNPLRKRIFREIKDEAGKYIVIFIFMTALISIVSGYLVADDSLKKSYDESFDKYNVEDGNFELSEKADKDTISEIEKADVTLYENFYLEESTDDIDTTLRIFADRKEVNKVCLLTGNMPENENEIALDRLYAKNNELSIGDEISVAGKSLKIVGTVALPDYAALYQNNTDFMFDSIKFGVAIVTDEGFDTIRQNNLHYSYSWKYTNPPADPDGSEAKEMSEDFVKSVSKVAVLTNYVPRYASNAINMPGDDLSGDKAMILALMYILIVIIAFVFAITTSNTIHRESNVIGTLRASGYTKAELIRHYLAAPIIVLFIAAIIGNILGYTWFKDVMADLYLGSYSLTTYKTLWNAEAFIETTAVPIIIMLLINFVMLARMMSLSPLKFIRRDLKRKQRKKAFKLNTKIHILTRFKIRIIFQNIPNYVTIFVGILFAGVILVFGNMFDPMLDHIEKETLENMPSTYQYILKAECETKAEDAEKFCAGSLKRTGDGLDESISIYGISEDSRYVKLDVSDEKVYITSAYADKYSLEIGDEITLKEEYGDEKFTLKVDGIYTNPSSLAIYVSRDKFNTMFDKDKEYYSGYMSDSEITDIDEGMIASKITEDDYTKSSRQLRQSMSNMMSVFWIVGVAVYMLVIYLLAKIIIEKNSQSISMTKILGYQKSEINRLYIHTTTIVTILSLIIVLPILGKLLQLIWHGVMLEYIGYIPLYIEWTVYAKVVIIGIITYAVVAVLLMKKTDKIPMTDALKNVE